MKSEINNLISKLKKYNYKFEIISENEVHIRIVKNVYIQIIINDEKNIIIKDLFKPYNILSGVIRSNMVNTIVYGSILFVYFSVLTVLLMYQNANHVIFLSFAFFLTVIIFYSIVIYFTIRIESTKKIMIDWTSGL